MFRAYKFRLEPNVNQARELEITLEAHRRLYNTCLEQRKLTYETEKRSISYFSQSAWFTQERITNPRVSRLNVSSGEATIRRLDRAFQSFFRRVKAGQKPGYPRFKGSDRFDSWTYPHYGDGVKVVENKLRLQHIGLVRINLHRPVEGTPKTVTVKREAAKWYVVICCELPDVEIGSSDHPAVGIDVGLENFLTASDGYTEPPLKPLNGSLRELRIKQRSLSRKKRGSSSRGQQRKVVAKCHARVANTRRDAHHKIAKRLVDRYGMIVVESLSIMNMLKNHRLARAIQDAGWGQFLEILKHHAASAGVEIVEVSARGTSQTCPKCGLVVRKTLSQRRHACLCGYSTHRDHAAAQVILSRGVLAGARPGGLNVGAVMPHGLRSRVL
jgi:putative transposase